MSMKRFYYALISSCIFVIVRSEIDRSDKEYGHNHFLTVNTGRVETVLMWLKGIDVWACAETCIRHLRCVSFNYQHEMEWCELTDRSFQVGWVDEVSPGWKNYATPDKVHGSFSEWSEFSECSVVCDGKGRQTRRRYCNNPTPMYGGHECVGKYVEEKECDNGDCVNIALNKPATQTNVLYGWEARSANDGNMESRSATTKNCKSTCWWQVDLQQVSSIHSPPLFLSENRNYISEISVKTSKDKLAWVLCGPIEVHSKNKYSCEHNAEKARYVKIEREKRGVRFNEVEVVGRKMVTDG